jgi:hypothetical protein
MLELLWLFYGFGGLHVHSAPRLTTLRASGAPCLASLFAGGAPCLTSLYATGAPRGASFFTPFHTGHRLTAWCWSGRRRSSWRWRGWLCLNNRGAADRGKYRQAAGVGALSPMSAFGGKADIDWTSSDVRL